MLFSLQSTDKTQSFVHLSFNSTLQLIKSISSDLQKLLKYFNDTAIVPFLRVEVAVPGAVLRRQKSYKDKL